MLFPVSLRAGPGGELNSFICDRVKNNRSTGPYFNSKYLIVTVPKYENAVNQFAEWKRTLGFDVQIAMQESWDTIAVRNVVRNAYMTNGLEYLLIFGGQNDVPAPIRDEIYNGEHHRHPTDLYYGCFGEGYTPDIFRGRLLVKTSEEAMTVVNKIINYEKNPVDDVNYYKRGIHCAQFEDERHFDYSTMSWIPVNGYEDQRFVLTSERIRNRMLSVIDSVNRVYYADSNVTPTNWNTPDYANGDSIPAELRDSLFKWDGDSADIIRLMNQKAFYVLMHGHGFSDKWYRPLFTRLSISHLSNGNYLPVVFSIACLTGKYNSSIDCFCERFLKKENGGCVAIYGASCESLSGPNDVLAEGMFDAIWPSSSLLPQFGMINGTSYSPTPIPDYHLGQILDQGLKRCNEAYLNTIKDWYPRYTYEVYHCFGDPSMMIHTLKPQPFTNASITRINDSIYVNTGGLLSNITFFNKRTGEVNSIMGFSHTYPNDPDISVCISAHNMIPYIDDGTLYLQNKTFTSSNNYKAQKIKVGNHVISNFPHGDVNFTQGNYTLMGEEVELQSGTTISAGVSLEIKNP